MTYLTENPWPLAVTFALVAMFFAMPAMRSGQNKLWKIAGVFVVLAVIPFITDQLVQTDRETVADELTKLRDTVVAGNLSATMDFLENKEPTPGSIAESIQRGMRMVDVHDDVRIKSVKVDVNGKEAVSDFRANGMVDVKGVVTNRHVATRWRMTWAKGSTGWKIRSLDRINPVNGEVTNMFSGD